jgi:non-canonical purine NTP pyrophosphatase (RdgB/HAM1 family)
MELVFATNNKHKLEEVKKMLPGVTLKGLGDIGCKEEINESAPTLEGNALLKAEYVRAHYGRDCFADDTGLEVEALGNKPGVHSARYSTEGTDEANVTKLLDALAGVDNRKARFRTVIALILKERKYFFEGIVEGIITDGRRGESGFGYDPVFIPEGFDRTFAELGVAIKNTVSHRWRAVHRMSDFLTTLCCVGFFLCISFPTGAQGVDSWGAWQSYPSYHSACMVEETSDEVFVLGGFDRHPVSGDLIRPSGALYAYGKKDQSITLYTKENGLSDTYISRIGYSHNLRILLLLYTNGNIDLLTKEGLYNIPHLLNNQVIRDKSVNGLFFDGDYVYLAANFGVMVINLRKREITDTYRIGVTRSVFLRDGELIATTDSGVFVGKQGDNLLDKANWCKLLIDVDEKPQKVLGLGEQLIVLAEDGMLYCDKDGEWQMMMEGVWDIYLKNGKLIVRRWSDIIVYTATDISQWFYLIAAYDLAFIAEDMYWIATGEEGLMAVKVADNKYETWVSGIKINGPKRDHAAFMTFHKDKLLVTGDGAGTFRSFRDATFMTYDGRDWYNFDEKATSEQAGHPFAEATGVAADPNDENHYFVGTWGDGVFEFLNGECVQRYDYTNSTLESFVPEPDPQRHRYVRVDGLAFDQNGNLWVTNSDGDLHDIKVRKPNGEWLTLSYDVLPGSVIMDKILLTRKNHKWINIPGRTSAGILAVDDRGTIDDPSDDVANFFSSFRSTPTSGGQTVTAPSAYYCMAEDLNGQIWLGTSLGPLICPTPSYAIDDPSRMYANRIVRTDEAGYLAYFLDGENVRAIAVDGGNRKWLGTQNSGLILVSEDGQETIAHFTTANSPLPSNFVQSIAIHPETGEVFVGTDKGIVSYTSGVTRGRPDYSEVTAFPNPVRPNYQGYVTVTNLVQDSYVRITDLNGHPVAEGKSVGGQFFWNVTRPSGEPVATGIYLVFAATEDAAQSVVTKIMVIR